MSLRSVCVKKSRSRVKNRVAHIGSFKIRVYSRNSWTKKLTFPRSRVPAKFFSSLPSGLMLFLFYSHTRDAHSRDYDDDNDDDRV